VLKQVQSANLEAGALILAHSDIDFCVCYSFNLGQSPWLQVLFLCSFSINVYTSDISDLHW
jgi:hypothetical protein